MKKTVGIIVFLILTIIIGFTIGMNLDTTEGNEKQLSDNIEKIEKNNSINTINKIEIETSSIEEKISIDTKVIEEVYYTECDHLLQDIRANIKNVINMNKEQIKRKYPDWEIKEFSKDKVVLYKQEHGYCGEHFIVKDVNGAVTVYKIDNSEKIKERVKITDIETSYLPKTDQDKLKEGIKVYSEQALNKLIEDFE